MNPSGRQLGASVSNTSRYRGERKIYFTLNDPKTRFESRVNLLSGEDLLVDLFSNSLSNGCAIDFGGRHVGGCRGEGALGGGRA